MAFKTMEQYNEEKFGGLFLLRNDKDYADVIFLYRGKSDVLIADTHYIMSADYRGYVHCCGKGCPACAKNIRVQTKLFIPLYNINTEEVEFWDRNVRFENQLINDVFDKYPNPSEYVFRITRNGSAGSYETTYSIVAIAKNTYKSYDEILSENKIIMPDYYENVVKDITAGNLYAMLNASVDSNDLVAPNMPSYQISPRNIISVPASAVSEESDRPQSINLRDLNSIDVEDDSDDNVSF